MSAKFLPVTVLPICFALPAMAEGFTDRMANLDESRWMVSDGWSNGNVVNTDWRRSQVQPGHEGISFVLDRNPASKNGYSSGEIQSHDRYKYGYFETRLKAAKGNGVVTGFFSYTGPTFGDPWDEIDIEVLGKNTRQVQFNYYAAGQGGHEKVVDLPFDASEGFHTFGFLWQPGFIRWYVDGQQMHEVVNGNLPQHPQKLFVDLWNGINVDQWLKPFVWSGKPIVAQVRCISFQPLPDRQKGC